MSPRWTVFSQSGFASGVSSTPSNTDAAGNPVPSLALLGTTATNPEDVAKSFGCCCGLPECCAIGSGKTWLVERTGSTCWATSKAGEDNNWLVYRCVSGGNGSFTIVGAGLIGYGELEPEILKLTYDGQAIGDEYDPGNEEYNCPTTRFIRVNTTNCISTEAVGTRTANGIAGALGFGFIAGNPQVGTVCGLDMATPMYYPPQDKGIPGGQGNWKLQINGVDPEGDYILQIVVSCRLIGRSNSFPTPFANPIKFFYIVGDNQGTGSEIDVGQGMATIFRCDDQMIEDRIFSCSKEAVLGNVPDCIVRYVYGYVTDYDPEVHADLLDPSQAPTF